MVLDSDRDQQPGLEVLQAERHDSPLPQVSPDPSGLHPVHPESETKTAGLRPSLNFNRKKCGKRKRGFQIGAACLLVVVGVTIGTVLGTQTKRSGDSGATMPHNDSQEVAAAEMTGSPTSVAPGLAPTAISHGYPHLEIFAVTKNTTHSIYRKHRNSNATALTDFLPAGRDLELVGGTIDVSRKPSIAVSRRNHKDTIESEGTNRTELHFSGTGNNYGYRKYHDSDELWPGGPNNSKAFTSGQYQFASSPTQVVYHPNEDMLKTFVLSQGTSGLSVFYYQWHQEDNSWSSAIPVQSGDMHQWSTPVVVAWAGDDTRLDVFVIARANNHLLHAFKDSDTDRWSEYEDLKGFVTTPPVAVSRASGTLDIFARGGDGGLWHLAFTIDGQWASWKRISATTKIQGQPDAISVSSHSIDVFAWGEDGSMLHRRYDSNAQQWMPTDGFEILINETLAGPPRAMTDGTGDIHIFAYSHRGELLWKTLDIDAASKGDVLSLADVPLVV
ncbi:hypothetical protein JX266_006068 [Neoarthrinium moseri]|nr:hypothetical protein JX266_006068 [Neoarthrinium moseri]